MHTQVSLPLPREIIALSQLTCQGDGALKHFWFWEQRSLMWYCMWKGVSCLQKKIPQCAFKNFCRVIFSFEKYTEPDSQLCQPLSWIKKKVDRGRKQAGSLNPALCSFRPRALKKPNICMSRSPSAERLFLKNIAFAQSSWAHPRADADKRLATTKRLFCLNLRFSNKYTWI